MNEPPLSPDWVVARAGSVITASRPAAIRTVALATDLRHASDAATTQAIALASQLGARLVVVNIVERRRLTGLGSHARDDQARREREGALLPVIQRARSVGVHAEYILWPGDPGTVILSAVEAEEADLLVVGTRSREGASRLFLGSVSDHLVRNAHCPVLVVRQPWSASG